MQVEGKGYMPKTAAQIYIDEPWEESLLIPSPGDRRRREGSGYNAPDRGTAMGTANNRRAPEPRRQSTRELPYEQMEGHERRGLAHNRNKSGKAGGRHEAAFTLRDKIAMTSALLLIGLVFIGLVFLSMYMASIQNDINKIEANAAVLQEDVENLQLAIEQKKNIAVIESKAIKLGMIYPRPDKGELIYLDDLQEGMEGKEGKK